MTAYDIITDQIIADIESGKASGKEWRMPWHSVSGGMPVNLASGKHYRGVNVLALWASAARGGFKASTWATYKQWQAVGANVLKGSKGTKTLGTGKIQSTRLTEKLRNCKDEKIHFSNLTSHHSRFSCLAV